MSTFVQAVRWAKTAVRYKCDLIFMLSNCLIPRVIVAAP